MTVFKSIKSDFKPPDMGIQSTEEKPERDPESIADSSSKNSADAHASEEDENFDASHPESLLKRDLDSRHIQFIALGGSIGTGFFIGSGSTLAAGGPAFLMIGFITMGFMIMTVIYALGELVSTLPVSGAFSAYATRFIDPAWGFAMGYNYWFQWVIMLPLESTACAIVVKFWDPDELVPKGAVVAMFLFVIVVINLFGVRGYAEFEFVSSLIKLIACVGFIIFAIVVDCGGTPMYIGSEESFPGPGPNNPDWHHGYLGAYFWHNPGAIKNGFKGFASVFTVAALAYGGTELVGIAAAETKEPRKTLPRATKQVMSRVLVFYLVTLFMITLTVRSDDDRLIGDSSYDPKTSPFVIAIQNTGVLALDHIFNAVIVISTLSVGNASVFASSRTLHSLAENGLAPKIFLRVDRQGRPYVAVALSLLVGLLGFLVYSSNQGTIFSWLVGITGLAAIFTWGSICATHIRFRRAWVKQGNRLSQLPWLSPLGELGSWIGLTFNVLVLCISFYIGAFPKDEGTMSGMDRAYEFFLEMISLVVILFLYLTFKIVKRTKIVRSKDMDLHTGRREQVPEEILEMERAEERAKPLWKKVLSFLY
ncbi:hypothetical protein MCUN1_003736 [Malassezia cuniculi]|uniref:Amino acid permease/ SLC12A domain-containing protein n=1 Tax=Malassezia cuniculi TaxID=948313 RepID=A0AAF0ETY3_9BASI|nr:hypothetical protein MCUN1_003736 [Malassezia cuniculi]